MRAVLTIVGATLLTACAAFGQDFEQVNTTSVQTLSGPKTLVAPILTTPTMSAPVLSGTVTGTYTLGGSPSLVAAVLSGTMTGTYTLGGSPTITAPILSGSVTGTYTLAGSPTITAPIFSGTITGTYTLGGTPTINSPTIATPTITGASIFGGTIRLPNNTYYLGRNAANSADVSLAKVNASDQIEFGGTVKNFSLDANPTTSLQAATKGYVDTSASNTLLSGQLNPVINGNLEIWQRGTSFPAIASGTYSADRFRFNNLTSGIVTINRSTNVPTVAQAGVLFNYSLEVDVTTADASIAAGDLATIQHSIEGYNWRHFAQRPVVLSFWVSSSKTGVHSVSLSNSGLDRGFVGEYTILAADTWEYKTITIPSSPSTGTWGYQQTTGVAINFILAGGSTFQLSPGSWQTIGFGNYPVSASQVNVLDNTANFFRVTGIKLELGTVATPIQFASFEQEIGRCYRYYQKSFGYAVAPVDSAGSVGEVRWHANVAGVAVNQSPTFTYPGGKMRQAPTVTLYAPTGTAGQVFNSTDAASLSSSSATLRTEYSFQVQTTGTAGTAVGELLSVLWTADAEL